MSFNVHSSRAKSRVSVLVLVAFIPIVAVGSRIWVYLWPPATAAVDAVGETTGLTLPAGMFFMVFMAAFYSQRSKRTSVADLTIENTRKSAGGKGGAIPLLSISNLNWFVWKKSVFGEAAMVFALGIVFFWLVEWVDATSTTPVNSAMSAFVAALVAATAAYVWGFVSLTIQSGRLADGVTR